METVNNRSRLAALISWLALQLGTLAIGSLRVPLSARAGTEPQNLAFTEMVFVQFVVVTALSPILVCEGNVLAVALTMLPFLQLAAFLTATPVALLLTAWFAMLMWMLGLRLWGAAIQSPQNRLITVAVLNCVVIGTPLATYLIREFSDSSDSGTWALPAVCNPLASLLTLESANTLSLNLLSSPIVLLLGGAIATAIQRLKAPRAKLST